MSNNRKIQGEIDKVIKKTNELFEVYDELAKKFEAAPSGAMKERLEGELKKEIKKLQRLREQLKAFASNAEVKDTKSLDAYRKKIGEKMEGFKVYEREMKTKAFSKEGLASESLGSPRSQVEAWLKSAIDEVRKRMEILDYEAQRSGARNARKGATKAKAEVNVRLDLLHVHAFYWETLLRMVINEELAPDEVSYLRSSVEALLQEDVDVDELGVLDLYDPFDLPEVPARKVAEELDSSAADEPNSNPSMSSKSAAKVSPAAKLVATPSGSSVTDAAKSAAAAQPTPQIDEGAPEETPEWMDDTMDAANDDTFGDDAVAGAGAGSLAEMANAATKFMKTSDGMPGASPTMPESDARQEKKAAKVPSPEVAAKPAASSKGSTPAMSSGDTGSPPVPVRSHPLSPAASPLKFDASSTLGLLDMSLGSLVHALDVELQDPYEPPNAVDPIEYFPQEVHPSLTNIATYRRFDLETLFFIFYYRQKNYQQYFASLVLKSLSYRYHKENHRWYQRRNKPIETSDTAERGSFVFFDFENKWELEEIHDFTFEYKHLETVPNS